MSYEPPCFLMSDNGEQSTSRILRLECRIPGIDNLFTTTYYPQTNSQVEWSSSAILAGLSDYVERQPKDWDLYKDILTYGYNTQIYRITVCTPFGLVLSDPPKAMMM